MRMRGNHLDQVDGCINLQKVLKLMRWFQVSNMTNGVNNGPGGT